MKYFYVICPVGSDRFFSRKRTILQHAGYKKRLVPFFPLEHRHQFSLKETLRDIDRAQFVVADLSFERPSCYFELGLVQAVGKRTYILAKKGTRIHQSAEKFAALTLFYSTLQDYGELIRKITDPPRSVANKERKNRSR
jgi:nucleoside 2-deoxyribosyltransferase